MKKVVCWIPSLLLAVIAFIVAGFDPISNLIGKGNAGLMFGIIMMIAIVLPVFLSKPEK